MINDLRSLAVFHMVADLGSFSATARRLKLSTSVVSHHISKLEARLGASLFFRSTRSLTLTAEGQMIRDAARRMVEAGDEALDALTDQSEQPIGQLRITLPVFGSGSSVHRALWAFARSHPLVAIAVQSSDSPVDLIKEGYDLGIRLGRLSDNRLKSRRIGHFKRAVVAAPSYLAARPAIETFDDLRACDFLTFSMLPNEITLIRGQETRAFTPTNVRLDVDTIHAGKSAVLAGLGVQNLPLWEIQAELDAGSLVEVLPSWRLPDLGIFVVWPDSGPQKRLTRRLIDYLVDHVDG